MTPPPSSAHLFERPSLQRDRGVRSATGELSASNSAVADVPRFLQGGAFSATAIKRQSSDEAAAQLATALSSLSREISRRSSDEDLTASVPRRAPPAELPSRSQTSTEPRLQQQRQQKPAFQLDLSQPALSARAGEAAAMAASAAPPPPLVPPIPNFRRALSGSDAHGATSSAAQGSGSSALPAAFGIPKIPNFGRALSGTSETLKSEFFRKPCFS